MFGDMFLAASGFKRENRDKVSQSSGVVFPELKSQLSAPGLTLSFSQKSRVG